MTVKLNDLLSCLANEKISINHLIPAGFCIGAIQHEHYITAVIIFVIGIVYCSLMEKWAKATSET
jgi:hypothetical protein